MDILPFRRWVASFSVWLRLTVLSGGGTTRTPHPELRIAQAREVPNHFLDELLPWLMQHRVLADEEVRRDLRRWVPEYQTTMPPKLQSVQSVQTG